MQSMQYVFEGKVVSHKDHDPSTPPLLLVSNFFYTCIVVELYDAAV